MGEWGGSTMAEPSLLVISHPQGRLPNSSSAMSLPVSTAATPGAARAALVSMPRIRAWATLERTMWA